MRHTIVIKLFIGILFFSGSALSFEPESKKDAVNIVSEKNETICKQKFITELFNQQRIFSAGHVTNKVRRVAERKIEAARDAYNKTGSYCDGYQILVNFNPENLESKAGDAQFE